MTLLFSNPRIIFEIRRLRTKQLLIINAQKANQSQIAKIVTSREVTNIFSNLPLTNQIGVFKYLFSFAFKSILHSIFRDYLNMSNRLGCVELSQN